MDYLNKNLKSLKENREIIYDKIKEFIQNKGFDFTKFAVLYARDGEKILEIRDKDKNIRLNSLYNPKREAEQWVKSLNFNNLDAPLIMFGIANGIFAREAIKRIDGSIAILLEPDLSLFVFCLHNFDMTDIIDDKRVVILVKNINADKMYDALCANVNIQMLNTQIICFHPKMEEIYCEDALEFAKALRRRMDRGQLELNTAIVLGDYSMENTIKNLHFIKDSNYVTDFIDVIPNDIPFIIVAAGPSLDKNINELKRAEGKAFIVVVDRAVSNVVEHNVKFDAIITVDAGKSVEYMNDPRCFDYPIFACEDSKNEILELNRGRKIWLNSTTFFYSLYGKHGVNMEYYSVGGSVATAAFNVARILKSRKIILVGQDLAYCGEATHAGGKSDDESFNINNTYVEGIDGNRIKTRGDWVRFLEWYKKSIQELGEEVDVIDATEGGAKIAGTKIMKLSDVINKYCKKQFCFKEILEKMPPTFDEKQYIEVRQDLLHLKNELETVKKCARRGKKSADGLKKIIENGEKDKKKEKQYYENIKKINEILEEQLVYNIIEEYIKKDIEGVMRNINCMGEDKEKNSIDTCKMSSFVYEKIQDGVADVESILDDALKRI